MFAWGENAVGKFYELGHELTRPERVPASNWENIKFLAVSNCQCCILLNDGSVHTFGNSDSSTKVTALETFNIVDIFSGGDHVFAVSDRGQVYGWGENQHGQLGLEDSSSNNLLVKVPKSIKFLQSRRVVQISCGKFHSLMLLHDGTIYSMGDNEYGQLGIGSYSPSSQPYEIVSLRGLPIGQVAASGWHSFCVTVSGRVFCWGRNDCGQLGLGDRANRTSPCLLRMLRSQEVMFVAAGDFHSAVLTKDGGVFTFGSSSKGQLGHGTISEFEVNPRKVFELMGSVVTQVACGQLHTIAFVPDSGNVFACGSGIKGQLGIGDKLECVKVPTIVKGPWCDRNTSQNNAHQYPGVSLYNIKEIAANGNQSFVLMCSKQNESALDFREVLKHRRIWTLNSELCERVSQLGNDTQVPADIINQLECVMSSQGCLNASFLSSDHHQTSTKYPGINMMSARLLFAKITQCKNKRVLQKIESFISSKLLPLLPSNPPDIEALRLYLSLPELPLLHEPECYDSLLFPFVQQLLLLAENPSKILDQWYRSLDPVHFMTPISMCQKCIVATIRIGLPPDIVKPKVLLLLNFLSKLNKVNNICDIAIVNFQKFYIPELNDLIPLEADYQQWARNRGTDFSFCRYPFVFNSKAKTILLQLDARFQMHEAYLHARGQNMAAFLGLDSGYLEPPVIEIHVRRQRLVEDAIHNIRSIGNLKRPFTVKFEGEEGQDAGGVRKEFFMLILQEVLNPKYGMFRHYKDSNLIWFTDYEIETDETYLLIGTICGLAIYNSTIIDLNFPLALYKKLLGFQPTLADLSELEPMVGSGMQQLLNFMEEDGDTVEETFGLDFTVPRELFGEVTHVDLIENGSSVAVTAENRSHYVSAYMNYIFNDSIRSPFEWFSKGFHKVCGGEVMNLFRPEELMEMVVGNQNYNWEELQKKTQYKGEYYHNHQVIIWFWQVFHSLTNDEKKDFVRFLTGYNKIPINGLEIIIQPMPFGDDYLPVAHTCFNVLDLPRYSSKEALETKLRVAIKSQGFYLA
ncbi:putative E3 ubiquitin-protein ligase HERC4 [Styela clava]